jgi:hypothetical protein
MSSVLVLLMASVALMGGGGVAASDCSTHTDCAVDRFCSIDRYCEICEYCADGDDLAWSPYAVSVRPVGDGSSSCPAQCGCSSHRECAAVANESRYSFFDEYGYESNYTGGGYYCASYSIWADLDVDGFVNDDDSETISRSVCRSCQELFDLGIWVPRQTQDSDAGDTGGASRICPDAPCLCAAASDCPEDHYCASDFYPYFLDDSYIFGMSHQISPLLGGETDVCPGFCVSCHNGCVEDLIVEGGTHNATSNGTVVACQDVCPSQFVQCDAHQDCWGDDYNDYAYEDFMEDVPETRWCSSNHQCNVCSAACALQGETVWEFGQAFPPIDETCPAGCCGWGVSKYPYWDNLTYAHRGIFAPCGATNGTEFFAAYLDNSYGDENVTVDDFLTFGYPCYITERDYWEWSSLGSSLTNNGTSDQQSIRLRRKAFEVECSPMLVDFSCDRYPLVLAFLIKPLDADQHSFVMDPAKVNDEGGYCYGPSSISSSDGSWLFGIFWVALAAFVCLIFWLIWKSGVWKNHRGIAADANVQQQHQQQPPPPSGVETISRYSAISSRSSTTGAVPVAIPVAVFGTSTSPAAAPPKARRPMTTDSITAEATLGVTANPVTPMGQVGPPPHRPPLPPSLNPQRDDAAVESDDEA